jgi:hypothetical protein
MAVPAMVVAYHHQWPRQFEVPRARAGAARPARRTLPSTSAAPPCQGWTPSPSSTWTSWYPASPLSPRQSPKLADGGAKAIWASPAGKRSARPLTPLTTACTSSPAAWRTAITSTCATTCGHPAQASRYAAAKRRLASLLVTDRTAYADGKAELIAGLLRARPMLQEAFEFGVLIAVGGVDVEVQPQLARLGLGSGAEDQSRLQPAEPFPWSDRRPRRVLGVEHDEAQHLAPEPRQPLRIPARDNQLGNATSRDRHPTRHQPQAANP